MQPTDVVGAFDDPEYFFEPWWPGTRTLAYVENGHSRLQVEQLSDAAAAFPELAEIGEGLFADGVVLDGTILVLDDAGRPDQSLLRARLAGEGLPGRPAFVAADLLWLDGRSWMRRAFRARRLALEQLVTEADRVIVGRGYERDGTLVGEALASMGIDAVSARRLDARHRSGPAGEAWLRVSLELLPVPERPSLALILRLPLDT